jgi:hypothetical protein
MEFEGLSLTFFREIGRHCSRLGLGRYMTGFSRLSGAREFLQILLRLMVLLISLQFLLLVYPVTAQETDLNFDQPETAGISAFRAHWNVPIPLSEYGATQFVDPVLKDRSPTAIWSPGRRGGKPGAIAFDALNRFLLVRFPGSATAILDHVRRGEVIKKVELVLPYRDTELWPPGDPNFAQPDGYLYRSNWGVDQLYRKMAPQWHAVAWSLRRGWHNDEVSGPTFNAFLNGAGYWTKFGAGDLQTDRFPVRFGPVEISNKSPEGSLDVTALLSDTSFGETLADRIRILDCCGFIISKLETYDARYFTGVYEWATATGGRAILVKTPRLIVKFDAPSTTQKLDVDLGDKSHTTDAAAEQKTSGNRPTAVLPSEEELAELARKFAAQPNWMPAWQWNRIAELKNLDGALRANEPFYYALVPDFFIRHLAEGHGPGGQAKPFEVYSAWVDSIIGRQPRGWTGFEPAPEFTQWFVYGDALPEPAREAFRRYWTAWLMPDRGAAPFDRRLDQNIFDGTLVHPQTDQLAGDFQADSGVTDSYYAKTGDWEGNKSFYRSGYNYFISTENFNHTAAAGALLGGKTVGAVNAIADGLHGWETYPVRLWSWSRGVSQEDIDHYYFAITLSAQKAVADFGPTPSVRLMSEGVLAKSLDELIGAYHPALRRFIAGSSRTSLEYLLAEQDGLQYVLHTLSRVGTLHDLDNAEVKHLLPGLRSPIGVEMPPLRAALQTVTSPWAPEWASNLVDQKPLPYRSLAIGDGVATSYLGKNYGLATDTRTRRIQFLAQWRRNAQPVEKMSEIVTVLARYGVNESGFANDAGGWIAPYGSETFLQHDNKALMLASPRDTNFLRDKVQKEGLKSLQTSLALFNYQQEVPDWEIYVDGERITKLPHVARAGVKIAIRDGATFFGVSTVSGTDLGGGATVVLREGTPQEWNRIVFKPALVVDSYNFRSERGVANPDWDRIKQAFGGFALELADSSDYPSFEAFQKHLASTVVQSHFDDPNDATASYKSGDDVIETKLSTSNGELVLVEPKINGRPAGLPVGILRDTTTSVQGSKKQIEKLGAVLRGDEGHMKFLQVEPISSTFVGWNPLPDLSKFSLLLPNGTRIQSDGGLGLARVQVSVPENQLKVSHSWSAGQEHNPGAATTLVLTGFKMPPAVEFNGVTQTNLSTCLINGSLAYLVPLQATTKSADEIEKGLAD